MGGWASAKLLRDLYEHFLPTETTGFADALSAAPRRSLYGPSIGRAATSFERTLAQELDRLFEGDPSLGDEGRIPRRRRLVRALLEASQRGA